jgi:ABC-2 type transport system ATP-binding protein
MSDAIRVTGLTKRYGKLTAVDGIDLTVDRGELYSLLGPNGAGKTTTIKMLCCLTRPSAGSAAVLGHDVESHPMDVKQVIAVSPQETAIAEHLDAWENLSLMARLHGLGRRETKKRSAELLEMMGLTNRAGDRVKKYSGGMKRRLSIAMALVSKPDVLFLDEPTLGLDPQARRGLWEYIQGLKGEMTIVLTTHYLEEADALADRIAVIDGGRVIAEGTPDELKSGIGGPVTVVETRGLTDEAAEALRTAFGDVSIDGDVAEIAGDVGLDAVVDCLRPLGIEIRSTTRKETTLDDVFLRLTGKEIRE